MLLLAVAGDVHKCFWSKHLKCRMWPLAGTVPHSQNWQRMDVFSVEVRSYYHSILHHSKVLCCDAELRQLAYDLQEM